LRLISSFVDPETGREKSEVSLWWDECGTPGDATTQAEEEGHQDGLNDGLCTLSALHCTVVYNTWLFLVFILHCFFLLPIFTLLVFFFTFNPLLLR
jgi:hypothetical protein